MATRVLPRLLIRSSTPPTASALSLLCLNSNFQQLDSQVLLDSRTGVCLDFQERSDSCASLEIGECEVPVVEEERERGGRPYLKVSSIFEGAIGGN